MIRDHLLKHGHLTVAPTTRMLRHWWSRINAELFGGELLPAQITYGDEPTEGYTTEECDGVTFPLGGQRVRLHIASSQTTKAAVLATLAHEMIHQWQYQNDQPMTHGVTFDSWADLIKTETGLTC
jgi:hypothetical protein